MPAEDIFEIRMMGGFSLTYAGKEIVLDRNTLSKTTQLLQMLVLYGREGIAKTSLVDGLYGRDDVENKNGSLNNTIFRMRKQLKAAGLPESNYINIKSGMCYWDMEIPTWIDILEFEDHIKKGRLEEDEQKQSEEFRRACKCYIGEFLPNMIGEDWVSVKNVAYRDMYFYAVEELCKYYTSTERYEDVIQIAHAAADIYPYEEWQIWEIDALIATARYKDAMAVYEKMTRVLMDDLGLAPTPEMLKRFRIMGERMSQAAGAIEDIKKRLQEKEMIKGAYYCTFPSFVDIYHIFNRIMERKGISVFIMLATLKNSRGQVCGEKQGNDRTASTTLKEAIRTSLRRGDFYTRYNHSQYLILLSEIVQENCKIVSDRIYNRFKDLDETGSYKIDFYVASIAEVNENSALDDPRRFRRDDERWKK